MGNKVSIKEKFEPFIAIKNPENLLSSLQELLTQKILDEDVKNVMLPDIIRKFINENIQGFKITVTEVSLHFLTSTNFVYSA